MDTVVLKLVLDLVVTKEEIYEKLTEICEREHSSCNSDCPIFKLNGGKALNQHNKKETKWNDWYGCDCFKNGKAMYDYIREHLWDKRMIPSTLNL
jgi:hypothetical protein